MTIKFDPNSLNRVFDKNFGAGAFNSGLNTARNAGRLKIQAKFAQQDYVKAIKAAQTAAEKATKEATKKSYQDAVNYWSDPKRLAKLQKKGAAKVAEDFKNDPQKQANAKAKGYNKSDYINAMYAAASKGNKKTFRSEREYNQYAKKVKNNVKNASSQISLPKVSKQSTKSNTSLLDKLKKSEVGRAVTAAEQWVNPFDKVSQKQAVKNYLNHKQSKAFQEVSRGANRAVDSASLGIMSNLDKKVNKRTPSYTSERKIGQGGATDMITSGLGYLIPYSGAYKAINSIGALTKLGEKSLAKRLLTEGIKGVATAGGVSSAEVGVKESLNPNDQNWKDNAKYIGTNMAIGAAADPLLYGAGKVAGNTLAKFAKGEVPSFTGKPSESVLDVLTPSKTKGKVNSNNLFDALISKAKQPKYETPVSERVPMDPKVQSYKNEFTQAVEKQYEYLKSSMGKGVDSGTIGNGLGGNFKEVNGRYSVSNNPKWYQDFYKANGRKPNDAELRQLAKEHVLNGFQDELGDLPAYAPSSVKEIDNQLDEIDTILQEQPEQASVLKPIVDALQQERTTAMNEFKQAVTNESKPSVNMSESINPTTGDNLLFTDPSFLQFFSEKTQSIINELTPVVKKMLEKNPKADVEQMFLKAAKENGIDLKSLMDQDLAKTGKSYASIKAQTSSNRNKVTSPNPEDGHGYGLINLQAESKGNTHKNTFNSPYKSGDPLPDTRVQIGTKTQRTVPGVEVTANKAYIKTVDNLHRLSQFDQQVEKVLGKKLNAAESTHTLGLNSRGSDMISKQILTQNMVDKNGEVVGKSLKEITMKVPKGKLKDFEDYLINKHAVTRMERGEKVFADEMKMTTAKSEAIVKNYEQQHPEFKDLAKEYYNYNKQLGEKWLVDTGILSNDQWEGYLKANPNYVPNNRIFSDLEKSKFGNNAKKGFANQSNPVKKATGSQRQIVSPIESTIEHTAQYVKTAKRNEVMQTLINNIKQNPEAFKDWAEIVPTKKTPESLKVDMQKTLEESGVDGVLEEFNKLFNMKPDLAKGNIVKGLIDGQPVHIKVNDPALLDALTNLTPKGQNIVISALGQVTRVMKNLTTGINPVFSLTRNIFRDIPTAYTNSKTVSNPFVFSKDLVESVISVMKNDKLYRSFKAVGGGHSSPISSDVNLLAQSKRSILPGEKGVWNATKQVGSKALGALENLNNAVESAPRLAEFKRLSGNSYESKMKALYEANDVTVNFNKYGNISKEIDSVVPYFNAAIQGLDKVRRVFFGSSATKTEKTTAVVKAFSAITIPSILMYAVNHNDPNYQKVSNYIKDTNILIPKGDGTFFKIPKPRELGIVFGSSVERVLRAWADNDPKAFEDFATSIKESFAPPIRTVVAPINDLRANKNFMNAPIIPGDLENLPPQYQYDSKTSEVSKKLGALFNFSPMKMDYLAKSYGGIIGELGIPATTKDVTIGNTLKQKVTVDPVFSNDLQRRFYETKDKLDQAHNAYTKQGVTIKDLNESLRKVYTQTNTQMGKVRKEMKQVQKDDSLTPQERLNQLRKYQEYINQLALQANQYVR